MLNLEIVTPEKRVLNEKVDTITIPTASGEIGILPSHAPLISALKSGILSYSVGNKTEKIVISSGFVEVTNDKVSVMADVAESSDEINIEAARLAQTEAEKVLAAWGGTEDEFETEVEKLERAQARLQLAAGK